MTPPSPPDPPRIQRIRLIDRNVRAMQTLLVRHGLLDAHDFGPLATLNVDQLARLERELLAAIDQSRSLSRHRTERAP